MEETSPVTLEITIAGTTEFVDLASTGIIV
jgi:hypothetical protein